MMRTWSGSHFIMSDVAIAAKQRCSALPYDVYPPLTLVRLVRDPERSVVLVDHRGIE